MYLVGLVLRWALGLALGLLILFFLVIPVGRWLWHWWTPPITAPRPQPTVAPGAQPAALPGGGVVIPTNPNDPANAYGPPPDPHWSRLLELNSVFRAQGYYPWLQRAGLTWDQIGPLQEARQIEEETSPRSQILAAGSQIRGRNIWVPWPNIVTTDRPNEVRRTPQTVEYKPDPNNPSVLYTNVYLDGQGTVWTSGFSWGQFSSRLGMPGGASTEALAQPTAAPSGTGGAQQVSASAATSCLSIGQLKEIGAIRLYQDTDGKNVSETSGNVAGVQIVPRQTWQKPEGWTFHYRGNTSATEIPAGQAGTGWSPDSCRPLPT